MQFTIENVLRVRPDVFWQLFFDTAYNEGLYRELRFDSYEVLELERRDDGYVRRKLRAVPPLSGPDFLKKQLRGLVYYVEEGHYDPALDLWTFENHTSLKAGTTQVTGTIRLAPHPEGTLQRVDLDVRVSALGLGGIVERQIEKGTRESYRVAAAYANRYAAEHGLLVAPAEGAPAPK